MEENDHIPIYWCTVLNFIFISLSKNCVFMKRPAAHLSDFVYIIPAFILSKFRIEVKKYPIILFFFLSLVNIDSNDIVVPGADLLHVLQRRAVQAGQGKAGLRLRQVHLQGTHNR